MWEVVLPAAIAAIGWLLVQYVFLPAKAFQATISDVSRIRVEHAKTLRAPNLVSAESRADVVKRLREAAAGLLSSEHQMPNFRIVRVPFKIPSRDVVFSAAKDLGATASWVESGEQDSVFNIMQKLQAASAKLGIYIPPEDRVDEVLLERITNRRR